MAAVTRQDDSTVGSAQVLPQNLDAEESVLGALMISRAAVPAAAEELSPEEFYRHSHGQIFRAALTLYARGEPVDAITLVAELERRGQLEEAGGKLRMHELAALVPAASNVRHYARLVRDCAHRRALLVDLQRMSKQVLSGEWALDETVETLRAVADARAAQSEPEQSLRFLSVQEFTEQPLQGTEPLLGEGKDRVFVPGGLFLLGGPGGVGKSTLALHMIFHLCAGLPWLGIPVPRPVRMLLIENEGPHDPFAEKVKETRQRWDGPSIDESLIVLDAPWGHFTWNDKRKAAELRAACRDHEVDVVVANPLSRLGMKGAGTPEETNAFVDLLFRGGMGEDFGVFIVHHTRKQNGGRQPQTGSPLDELSGAWGPHPDTVMILQSDGTRRVKLSFDKVRWGEQGTHGPFVLQFEEDPSRALGYRPLEANTRTEDGLILERIDEAMRKRGGPMSMTDLRTVVTGNNNRIASMVKRGVSEGRYRSDGRGKARYWLAEGEPELADWSTVEETTQAMADERGSHAVPLAEVRERMADEGYTA